jgi:hemerythrin
MTNWSDADQLGYGPMDAIHEEFLQLIGRLQSGRDDQLVDLLGELANHLEAHFEEENRWMRESEFPARDCHIEQHDAVLESVHEVQKLLAQGDTLESRRLVAALDAWFPNHTAHLDSALAHWMCKRRFGGKPVVFRRSIQSAELPG